jgi:hypothetical protein
MPGVSTNKSNLMARFPALFDELLEETLKHELPAPLAQNVRSNLAIRSKNIRSRIVLACSQMVLLPVEAAAAVAVSLELCQGFSLNGDIALIPTAVHAYLKAEPRVEPAFLVAGLHRLMRAVGPLGVIGSKAGEQAPHSESTLDELRQFQLKETGLLFATSLMVPKDLMGISDDSSQGLALDIFSKELSSAFRTLEDLERTTGEDVSPQHILYYLPLKEAKSMTLQRLNSATLSLSSTWTEQSLPLVQIAEEFARRLESAGNGES